MNKEILNAIVYFGSLALDVLKVVAEALNEPNQA
jgi:hypothetical protein